MKLPINRIIFALCTLVLVVSAAGCRKERPKVAVRFDQLELTSRFFESVAAGKSEQAIRQGEKIYILNPNADYIPDLIGMLQSNRAIALAVRLVANDRINDALQVVRKASARYEGNRELATVNTKLSQLRNAKKLIAAMDKAKSSSSMRSARLACRAGLSRNITPELEKYLSDYELKEATVAAKEKAAAIEADKAVQRATLQAKIEEKKRRQADRRFAEETAKKTAAGEKARRTATDRPDPKDK